MPKYFQNIGGGRKNAKKLNHTKIIFRVNIFKKCTFLSLIRPDIYVIT